MRLLTFDTETEGGRRKKRKQTHERRRKIRVKRQIAKIWHSQRGQSRRSLLENVVDDHDHKKAEKGEKTNHSKSILFGRKLSAVRHKKSVKSP